jgi:hypothetical protein
MKWENKYNLPDRVLRVIKGGHKDKVPDINRLSITDLIEEPLARALYINFYDDIISDYSDLLLATQGTALHERYERCAADDDDAEHKFEDVVNGMTVVGMADNYFDNTILDLKQTGVYGPKYKIDKWTAQLNCYAWQRRKRKMYEGATADEAVNKLFVDVWYRDWKQNKTYYKGYPPIPFEIIELKLWTFEEQDAYIKRQVDLHRWFTVQDSPKQYGIPCSNKTRGIRFEAYKKGNKTPTKVEDTKEALELWVKDQTFNCYYEIRKSAPVFCNRYCKARSVCPFVEVKK